MSVAVGSPAPDFSLIDNARQRVNLADQRGDPDSLLNWTGRVLRMRKECPEISWGDFVVVRTNAPDVLVLRYDWRRSSLVTLHNFSKRSRRVTCKVGCPHDDVLASLTDGWMSRAANDGTHQITLKPYGWRWLRVGARDNALTRSTLTINDEVVT